MTEETSPYTPSLIDSTLRSWDKWASLAEGIGTSVPDAHRSSKGKRYDPLTHADRRADIERAMATLQVDSLGLRVVDKVRYGYSVSRIALVFGVRKQDALNAYDQACKYMASYLGWICEHREP